MTKKKCTADQITDMASRGADVSAYFTNKFTVVRPVIKTLLGRALAEERVGEARPKTKAS
jgi:hypothetical protein